MKHYLGPDRPLTILSTWDNVRAAAQGGLLGENQWCELKKALGPSSKGTNTELARDLASLSVYGGSLIFGIVDKTHEVVGCDVTGMRDRISQVASMNVDPPLAPIIFDPIPGPEGKSVLIVSVPPSPLAPHMVSERYYGRSAEGKRVLSDPEVRTLILSRQSGEQEFRSKLLELAENDPLSDIVENGPYRNGHAFFMAEPCSPTPHQSSENLDLVKILTNLRHGRRVSKLMLRGCTVRGNDPDGLSFASGRDRVTSDYEHYEAHVSVRDDHTITATSGGASRWIDSPHGIQHKALVEDVLTTAAQFLELVLETSKSIGYLGEWRIGVHMNSLAGSTRFASDIFNLPVAFPRDTCTNSLVMAPLSWDSPDREIEDAAVRLLVKFTRGLGVDGWSYGQIVNRH